MKDNRNAFEFVTVNSMRKLLKIIKKKVGY